MKIKGITMNILIFLVILLLLGIISFFALVKLRPANKKHSALTQAQANITAIGAFILAGCSVSLSTLFFYSLSDNLLTAVILVKELGIKQSSVSKLYARYQKQQKEHMRA